VDVGLLDVVVRGGKARRSTVPVERLLPAGLRDGGTKQRAKSRQALDGFHCFFSQSLQFRSSTRRGQAGGTAFLAVMASQECRRFKCGRVRCCWTCLSPVMRLSTRAVATNRLQPAMASACTVVAGGDGRWPNCSPSRSL